MFTGSVPINSRRRRCFVLSILDKCWQRRQEWLQRGAWLERARLRPDTSSSFGLLRQQRREVHVSQHFQEASRSCRRLIALVPRMRQDAETPAPSNPYLLPLRSELEVMASELLRAKHQQLADGQELFDKVLRVKVQLLRLLTEDLVSRLRNEWRFVVGDAAWETLEPLLEALRQDAQHLQQLSLAPDSRTAIPRVKTGMRQTLWQLRCALEPGEPPAVLQMLVEQLRSCLMDNKFETLALGAPSSHEPSQVHSRLGERDQTLILALQLLVQDNFLMLELLSLRILQHEVQSSCASWDWIHGNQQGTSHLNALRDAATHLHLGTYRVRGRSRLLHAAKAFSQYLTEIERQGAAQTPSTVRHSLGVLQEALEEDMAYATLSPDQAPALHGESMLLRPRPLDIPNFEVVVPNRLLRGGQPTLAGIQWLRDYGVRVTIDLRGTDRANQWNAPHEEAWGDVRRLGFHIEDFSAPTLGQVLAFVQTVNEPSNWPLYVSCKAGIGRTGTMVACWRITQGVGVEQALAQESLYATDGGGIAQEAFVRKFATVWNTLQNEGGV